MRPASVTDLDQLVALMTVWLLEADGLPAGYLVGANAAAQRVYRKAGFVSHDRQLLTLSLATPMHVDS